MANPSLAHELVEELKSNGDLDMLRKSILESLNKGGFLENIEASSRQTCKSFLQKRVYDPQRVSKAQLDNPDFYQDKENPSLKYLLSSIEPLSQLAEKKYLHATEMSTSLKNMDFHRRIHKKILCEVSATRVVSRHASRPGQLDSYPYPSPYYNNTGYAPPPSLTTGPYPGGGRWDASADEFSAGFYYAPANIKKTVKANIMPVLYSTLEKIVYKKYEVSPKDAERRKRPFPDELACVPKPTILSAITDPKRHKNAP